MPDGETEEVDWEQVQEGLVIENVAYTLGDYSQESREAMKAQALAHALDHERFLHSHAGSRFVSDSHPGIMSCIFPHLDPWGIGGFNHSARSKSQWISFESHVKCLLRQDKSMYSTDFNFAFICWNIMMQKRPISIHNTFVVKTNRHRDLSTRLRELAPVMTDITNSVGVCRTNRKSE